MGKWQNTQKALFQGDDTTEGIYGFPKIEPAYELPDITRYIEFDYCKRVRDRSKDNREDLGVHFFEDDYKFERCWTSPDKYGEMLSEFGLIIGPDFSHYGNFPDAVNIYNHYRNNWLVRYWQICYDMIIVPTILWGPKESYDWCFDGYPHNSIVAVSNVGVGNSKAEKEYWMSGYTEMLKRLEPSMVLLFTRNFAELPGNVKYIRWELHKGEQVSGKEDEY